MYRITEVVKNLIFINAIIFLCLQLPFFESFRNYFILYPTSTPFFKPVQMITHMFNHGNMSHLFFNMLALFFFGPSVEDIWGPKKFLLYYFICGVGSMVLHMLIGSNSPVLGASGAISGVLVAFAFLYPDRQVMLLIPPIPMKAKYLVIGILAIDLYFGLSHQYTGIAHFAHLGGALFGAVAILYWRNRGQLYR